MKKVKRERRKAIIKVIFLVTAIFIALFTFTYLLWKLQLELVEKSKLNKKSFNLGLTSFTKEKPIGLSEQQTSPQPCLEFEIEVEKSYFKVLKNGELTGKYKYKEFDNYSNALFINNNVNNPVLFDQNTLIFQVGPLPTGCESGEDIACLEYLASIIKEFEEYGGIWKIGFNTKEPTHLFSIPKEGQINTNIDRFEVLKGEGKILLSLALVFKDGSDKEMNYEVDILTGEILLEQN